MSKVARATVANVCLEEPSSKRARLPIPLCCDETITSLPGRAASQDCSDAVVAKGDLSDDSDWCKWKAEILTEEDLEAMLEDTDGPPSRIHGQADGPTDFSHLVNHGAGAAARGHGDVLPMAEADEQPLSTLSLCCPDPQFEPVLSLQADAEEEEDAPAEGGGEEVEDNFEFVDLTDDDALLDFLQKSTCAQSTIGKHDGEL